MLTVADLKDQTGLTEPRPILYCCECGTECSANASDYFDLPKSYKMICCYQPMKLVVKKTVFEECK